MVSSRTENVTGHSQSGFLFDVTAKQYDVAITAVTFIPGTQDGEYDIWTASDRHEQVHHNAQAWTLVAENASHAGPRGQTLRVSLPQRVQIPAGQTHSLYISGNNVSAVCFSTECNHSNSAENADLIIHLGHFKAIPWEGVLSTGPFGHNGRQEFVGSLEYQVLQSVAADQVISTTARLWEKRLFADAELVAATGERFAVHRSVLAANSSMFEDAWRNFPMGEDPVLQVDASASSLEAVLRFLYTGCDETLPDPGEILKLAHHYGLPSLVRTSAMRLALVVNKANAVDCVRALRPYKENEDCQAAWNLMLRNLRELLIEDNDILHDLCMSL